MAERLDIIISAKDEASPALDKAGSSLGRIGEIAGGIVTSQVLAKVADQLMQVLQVGIKEALEAEVNFAKLDAIIKSTGGAAGVTTKEMIAMADAFQGVSRFSHDTINEAQAILLTFTNLGKDVLPVAIERAMDMAEVFGMDLPSAAKMLAITLDQPAEGIGRLSRVIGKLDPEIEKTIIGMAEMGDTAGAQAAILDVLNSKFGGVAQTVGVTTDGAFQRLQNRLLDFAEGIGSGVTEPVGAMANKILDEGIPAVDGFTAALQNLGNGLGTLGGQLGVGMDILALYANEAYKAMNPDWQMGTNQGGMSDARYKAALAAAKAAGLEINPPGGEVFGPPVPAKPTAAQLLAAKEEAAWQAWLNDKTRNQTLSTLELSRLGKKGATPGTGAALSALGDTGLSMSMPDVLARAFGSMGEAQGWQGAFQSAQGRAAGVTDVRDKMAGDMFSQKYGRAATQGEWEQRYYKGSFEGIDEKGAGLDDMFGKPGTWGTLIAEQTKEDKKRVDELNLAFRKSLRDSPLPVTVVGTPVASGGDAATSSLQVEHFSTTLSRARA
jgi:hypothetical protein